MMNSRSGIADLDRNLAITATSKCPKIREPASSGRYDQPDFTARDRAEADSQAANESLANARDECQTGTAAREAARILSGGQGRD